MVIFILVNITLSILSNFFWDNRIEDKLIKYQISKIKKNEPIKNIFLGDSSLGNAINAKIFEELSGEKSVNLALYGNASFEGAYALIQNIKSKKNQNIFIVTSLDVWNRSPSPFSYDLVMSHINFTNKIKFLFFNIFNYNLNIERLKWYLKKNEEYNFFDNDYILQKKNKDFKKNEFKKIKPERIKFLIEILNFCQKNQLNCVYIHGPIYDEHCLDKNSVKYINEVKYILKKNRIKSFNHIFCMKKNELGDSDDHINPNFKNEFTKIFYSNILKNKLLN